MTIFTALKNVFVSIFVLIKTIVMETAKAIRGFYTKHPVIAAYLTGFVVTCVVAVLAYNYGANGGKIPFGTFNHTETTDTAQDDTISETSHESEPQVQPVNYIEEDSPESENTLPSDLQAKIEAKGLKGIDVSEHNPPSAWQGDLDKIDFVIVKVSEGYTYTDPCLTENLQTAKDAGKLIGAYHLVRPESGVDAATEAQFFVDELTKAGWDHTWLLACDFEPQYSIKKADGSIDYAANANFCNAFLDEVTRLTGGVRPLMYACAKDINNGGNSWKAVAKSYGLWMAGYPQNSQTDSGNYLGIQEEVMPYNIGVWKYLTIWQYSSAGHLDKDVAYMSPEAWSRFANPTDC